MHNCPKFLRILQVLDVQSRSINVIEEEVVEEEVIEEEEVVEEEVIEEEEEEEVEGEVKEEEEENLCPKKYHKTHTHVYLNVTDRKERYLTLINTQYRHL